METIKIDEDVITTLENKREVEYGVLFNGLTERQILWKLVKFNKNNDKSKDKIFLVDGYYFGIYIGQALMKYHNEIIDLNFVSTDRRF